jgi:hypothetical protein
MKKLLATTALAGVVLTGSAFAQTTVSGELRLGYKAMSHGAAATSSRGFGTEQQINIQNKGKTNIGWDYAAGFSLENDGEQTGTLYNENVYMDFINPGSGTMITIGRDHIQRSDSARNASLFFGYDASDIVEGVYSTTASQLIQASPGAAIGQSYGIGIVQDVAKIGKLSYNYVPTTSAAADSEGTQRDNSTGGYEVGFTGNLGVAGLNTYAFKQETSSPIMGSAGTNNTVKAEVKNFGVSYSVGQISAGYERTVHQGKSTTLGNKEITENGYGVAYAITKDLSIQGHLTKAKQDGAAAEAEVKSIQLGYNLGPVALVVGYGEGENVNGATAVANQLDGVGFVRLLGAF